MPVKSVRCSTVRRLRRTCRFLTAGHYCLFSHLIRCYLAVSLNCTAIWYGAQKQCVTGVETLGYAAEDWLDFCQLVCSSLTSQLTSHLTNCPTYSLDGLRSANNHNIPVSFRIMSTQMPSKCTFQKLFPVAYNFKLVSEHFLRRRH